MPEGKKRSPFTRFFAQFNNILVYVLLTAGFTKLMLSLWIDTGIIYVVVVAKASGFAASLGSFQSVWLGRKASY